MGIKKDSSHPFRLLVEGKDDLNSVIHLVKASGLEDWEDNPKTPFIDDCEGVQGILNKLRPKYVEALLGSVEILGIIADANASLPNRWTSIISHFVANGVNEFPDTPLPIGTVIDRSPGKGKLRRIGIWLMPDNTSKGALEQFIEFLVPDAQEELFKYAGECSENAKKKGAPFAEEIALKAQLHTWLAWGQKPGLPFGTAIAAKVLDATNLAEDSLARNFLDWFFRLYEIEPPT